MTEKRKIIHILGMLIILTTLWLLLSGHYTLLIASLGVVSVISVAWITLRMDLLEFAQPDAFRQTLRSFPYGVWLIREIIKANIDVCLRILNPALPIQPQLVNIKATQQGDLARASYANSITLTPGTISIDVDGDYIEVHALSVNGVEGLAGGEMDRRITQVEAIGYH